MKLDVPITSVFLFLFILAAIGHMTIFQINKRQGHKFVMSVGFLFLVESHFKSMNVKSRVESMSTLSIANKIP